MTSRLQQRKALVAAIIAAAVSSTSARAGVLVETYEGERPPDATRVLAPLRTELQSSGVLVEPAEIVANIGDLLPLPGTSDPSLTTRALIEQIDAATAKVTHEQFPSAITIFDKVLASLRDNPVLVVGDASAPVWLTKAYMQDAFAHARLGQHDQASAVLSEQIRSFPDRPITSGDFGPDAEKLYLATRKTLDQRPRGSVLVSVPRPDAQIYIDFVGRGRGGTFTGDLTAGPHRLLIQSGGVARRYTVTIDPSHNAQTELRVDWDLDSRFVATPDWIGAVWEHGHDRTGELLGSLVRRLPNQIIAAVSIQVRDHKRYVVGFTAAAGSTKLDTCAIVLGERDAAKLHALARCLVAGERTSDLVTPPAMAAPAAADRPVQATSAVPRRAAPPIAPPPLPPPSTDSTSTLWIPEDSPIRLLLAVGLGTGIGGALDGGLFVFSKDDKGPGTPRTHNLLGPGLGMIGGGVVLGGACLYLLLRTTKTRIPSSMPTASLMPGGAAIGWSTTF